jgi:hypothetical protein
MCRQLRGARAAAHGAQGCSVSVYVYTYMVFFGIVYAMWTRWFIAIGVEAAASVYMCTRSFIGIVAAILCECACIACVYVCRCCIEGVCVGVYMVYRRCVCTCVYVV